MKIKFISVISSLFISVGIFANEAPAVIGGVEMASGEKSAAFEQVKKKLGKLSIFEEKINIIDKKLFSYTVNLPKNIHSGKYKIKMTLIDQQGIELSKSEQSVKVSKVGVQEFLSSNSKNNPVFYGLFSVIIALFLGFSAAQLFRWMYR